MADLQFRYTREHEWLSAEENQEARVGISDYAQG
jgi:glycine cleavage system H lipoate-binding protein